MATKGFISDWKLQGKCKTVDICFNDNTIVIVVCYGIFMLDVLPSLSIDDYSKNHSDFFVSLHAKVTPKVGEEIRISLAKLGYFSNFEVENCVVMLDEMVEFNESQ